MALDHDDTLGTWTPSCEICGWKGEPDQEQGKAQAEYLRHCKTPDHKKQKEKTTEELAGTRGETPAVGETVLQRIFGDKPHPQEKENLTGLPMPETLTEEETVLFHGEEGIQKLKRAKLEKSLTITPRMTANIKTWVLSQYDQDSAAQIDYNALYMLLISSQIPPQFAQRIVQNIMTMEQRLRALLQQRQQTNTPFFSPGQPSGMPGTANPVFIMTPQGIQQVQVPQFINPLNPGAQNPNAGGYMILPSQQDPKIDRLEKAVEGLAARIEALHKPEPKEERGVEELIEEALERQAEKEKLTKEDVLEIVTKAYQTQVAEKERESGMQRLTNAMESLSEEVKELRHRPAVAPMPKDISEEGSLEGKKLDIIGNKLGDIHDTTKVALGYLMGPESKPPAKRSEKDLTELDETLEKIAKTA